MYLDEGCLSSSINVQCLKLHVNIHYEKISTRSTSLTIHSKQSVIKSHDSKVFDHNNITEMQKVIFLKKLWKFVHVYTVILLWLSTLK